MGMVRRLVPGLALATALGAVPAAAQSSGPLVLQPIASSVIVAPDVKVTTVNDTTATLAGFYAGKQVEQRALVGAAVYWLADPRDSARLFYGGLIASSRLVGSDRLNVSGRILAGLGQGTAYRTYDIGDLVPQVRHGRPFVWDGTSQVRLGYRDRFAVLEPELRLNLRVTEAVSVTLGAGYRATSADRWLNDAFRGATGSFGVQIDLAKQ